MIKCVIDTNIVISAILNPKGIPGKIVEAWFKHEFLVVTSEFLLQELQRVLHYPYIQRIKLISENEINKFVLLNLREFREIKIVKPIGFLNVLNKVK